MDITTRQCINEICVQTYQELSKKIKQIKSLAEISELSVKCESHYNNGTLTQGGYSKLDRLLINKYIELKG